MPTATLIATSRMTVKTFSNEQEDEANQNTTTQRKPGPMIKLTFTGRLPKEVYALYINSIYFFIIHISI